jgi:agmatinase
VYEHNRSLPFGGALPVTVGYDEAAAIVFPVPFDRTTSYMPGTRNGPRELLLASAQVELWDEEVGVDVHQRGLFTLPELDLSAEPLDEAMTIIGASAGAVLDDGKFLLTIGGEHSITPPLAAAAHQRFPGLSVLQIDAHADLRGSYHGQRNSHACAMRRVVERTPAVQVGIRNMSSGEVDALPGLNTTIFYDWNMRDAPNWIDRVVAALTDTVYITIDLDGLDPSLMPAVGTPEPGGLQWHELTRLLRRTFERRRVVACDVVELCPIPGMVSPNFVAARLAYKLLTYQFGLRAD